MAANELSFNQVATLLNSIQQMVTGQTSEIVSEGDFATVATTVLKSGYEQVYNAISAVLGRTIFSIRPYTRKFQGLERTDGEFKLHTRKLQIADTEFEDNDTMKYPVHVQESGGEIDFGDGQSVDQQIIKKSKILQTNFYGMNTYQNHYTIFDEQLDVAFSSSAELGRFFQMIIMNMDNMFEQARESFARMNLVNYIAAIKATNPARVIDLLLAYNLSTEQSLTAPELKQPANYAPFMRWAFAYIQQVQQLFTERTMLYQNQINNLPIIRHTPIEDQRLFIFAPEKFGMDASVLSTTYHDSYLKRNYTEVINFWQTPDMPETIEFTPTYTGDNGAVVTSDSSVELSNVFGVLMDKEALGYSVVKTTVKPAPYNARADYRNFFMKDYHKAFMDLTEKGVVFVIEGDK